MLHPRCHSVGNCERRTRACLCTCAVLRRVRSAWHPPSSVLLLFVFLAVQPFGFSLDTNDYPTGAEDPSVDYFPSIVRSRAPLDERVRRFLWQFGDELPPSFRVARIDDAGLGLVVVSEVLAGEKVLYVSANKFFSVENCAGHVCADYLRNSSLPTDVSLPMLLLCELSRGSESNFASYLNIIPLDADLPVTWSRRSLEVLLRKSPALHDARRLKSRGQQLFHVFVSPLLQAAPRVFPPSIFGPASFLRAFALVLSRSTVGMRYLVPVMDLLNHAPAPLGCVQYSVGNGADERLVVQSTVTLSAGYQVYLDYGSTLGVSAPNEKLLVYYGFAIPGNRNEFVKIRFNVSHPMKQRVLAAFGISPDGEFAMGPNSSVYLGIMMRNGVPSSELLLLARVLGMNVEDRGFDLSLRHLTQSFRYKFPSKSLSQSEETKAVLMLASACEGIESRLNSSNVGADTVLDVSDYGKIAADLYLDSLHSLLRECVSKMRELSTDLMSNEDRKS